jgi:hypothetical protein
VASGQRGRLAGLGSLPTSAVRVLTTGLGFVIVSAALFAGVGFWQDRDTTRGDAAGPVDPAPPPAPAPAPPEGLEDDGDDGSEGDDVGTDDPDGAGEGDAEGDGVAPETPATQGPRPADVTVQLLNGIGPDGSAAVTRVRTTLSEAGFRISAQNTGRPYDVTTIFYTVGFEAQARLVASTLGVTQVFVMTDLPPERRLSATVMVHVVVGADRR